MLSFNLHEIFKARQIDKPYSFLVKAGISPQSAEKIVSNQCRVFRLDHIEILCKVLHCEPNDLLTFSQDIHSPIQENHPLHKLIANDKDLHWNETLRTLPLSQLKELSKQLANPKEE
jgi:DNA-binding Xre family transcriptional regulator